MEIVYANVVQTTTPAEREFPLACASNKVQQGIKPTEWKQRTNDMIYFRIHALWVFLSYRGLGKEWDGME